jgi:hypothetical protein
VLCNVTRPEEKPNLEGGTKKKPTLEEFRVQTMAQDQFIGLYMNFGILDSNSVPDP